MQAVFSKSLTDIQPVASRLMASAMTTDRMVHAFLLTGRDQDSKWILARQMAIYLNCQKENKLSEGACLRRQEVSLENEPLIDDKSFNIACQNCKWLYKNEHPKAWYVLSDESGKSGKIPVEAARNLSEELARTSNYIRVVVVEDASEACFHRPAANALLKTIEEPRSSCLFLFFAPAADDVLATIVSRCQVIPFNNRREDNLGVLDDVPLTRQDSVKANGLTLSGEIAKRLEGQNFISLKERAGHAAAYRDALKLAQELSDLIDDEFAADEVVDTALALEIRRLKGRGASLATAQTSRYLSDLLKIGEDAKRRIDQYVGKKAVCESFVLTWLELRQKLFN